MTLPTEIEYLNSIKDKRMTIPKYIRVAALHAIETGENLEAVREFNRLADTINHDSYVTGRFKYTKEYSEY